MSKPSKLNLEFTENGILAQIDGVPEELAFALAAAGKINPTFGAAVFAASKLLQDKQFQAEKMPKFIDLSNPAKA